MTARPPTTGSLLVADFGPRPLSEISLPDLEDEQQSLEWELLGYEGTISSVTASTVEKQLATRGRAQCRKALSELATEILARKSRNKKGAA